MATSSRSSGQACLAVVCNSGDNSLSLYVCDDAGALRHLSDVALSDVGAPDGAYPMAVSPDQRYLYVAFRGKPHTILSYCVDVPGRALRLLGVAPMADSMAHIATDRTGRFLFAAAYKGGSVSVHPIGANGVVQGPLSVLDVAPNMHCCLIGPQNELVLVTSLGDDSIVRFEFDPTTGTISELDGRIRVASGSGPRHIVWHPNQRFAYLINQSTTTIDVLGFDAAGRTLHSVQTISGLPEGWTGEAWAADIRITPDGRLLYASDRKANTITGFAVDISSGLLSRLGHANTSPWPRAFNIAPDGRTLIVLGEVSDTIECFAIMPESGVLEIRSTLPTGKGPSWVEIFN